MSEQRFRNAVDKLFPDTYKKYNIRGSNYDLYAKLRCGVNHSTAPGLSVGLSERKNPGEHLFINDQGRLELFVEDFYDDFKLACEKVIKMLDDKIIKEKFQIGPF